MIPTVNPLLQGDMELTSEPTLTYCMELDSQRIQGRADEQEAMVQAIYKILNTERYEWPIYTYNYGIELLDLYGEPVSWVIPELERRIREALTQDDRITEVDTFDFEIEKDQITAYFTVHTVFGSIPAQREVTT